MEALCSWNGTWQVGKNEQKCFKQYCDAPKMSIVNDYSKEDWCPGGITVSKSDETKKWTEKHFMDASERLEAERLCRWNTEGDGIGLDKLECYAINCAFPNTTVNELFNYNFEWQESDPMTKLKTYINYPCVSGSRILDPDLWWKEDAPTSVDVYCDVDGEYKYPDPWLTCFPGKKIIYLVSL